MVASHSQKGDSYTGLRFMVMRPIEEIIRETFRREGEKMREEFWDEQFKQLQEKGFGRVTYFKKGQDTNINKEESS